MVGTPRGEGNRLMRLEEGYDITEMHLESL